MKAYYLECVVCGARIKISKKLKEWLEEHYGNLGILVERYPEERHRKDFHPDTKVLRFRVVEEELYTPREALKALAHKRF